MAIDHNISCLFPFFVDKRTGVPQELVSFDIMAEILDLESEIAYDEKAANGLQKKVH